MREIKFRAFDEGNKVMHNDFEFIRSGTDGNDWIVFKSDKQKLDLTPHPFENPYFAQQLKIMQFTGLKDKNGKDIYEGDLFKKSNGIIAEVAWDDYHACFGIKNSSLVHLDGIDHVNGEVVGNIYENLELIKP